MKTAAKSSMAAIPTIDDHVLAEVIGGAGSESSDDWWSETKRWIKKQDLINYGVGAATGLAIGPLAWHAAEKSWRVGRWGMLKIRRVPTL